MRNSRNESQVEVARRTPDARPDQASYDLLDRLDHLLVTLPLYPQGHARNQQILEGFLASLAAVAAGRGTLYIDVDQDSLDVQMKPVVLEHPSARKILAFLSDLQIVHLNIDVRATTDDLYQFATTLLRARHEASCVQTLRQFAAIETPETIQVTQRELGRRGEVSLPGTDHKPPELSKALRRVLRSLDLDKLDPGRQANYRGKLELVFGKLAQRAMAQGADGETADAPGRRSLDYVLQVGVHAVQAAIEKLSESKDGAIDFRHFFKVVEKTVLLSEDRESAELIIEVLNETIADDEKDRAKPALQEPGDGDHAISLAELCRGLESLVQAAGSDANIEFEDPAARLSVLLELAIREPRAFKESHFEGMLKACAHGMVDAEARQVFAGALLAILEREDVDLVARLFPPLLKAVRNASPRALPPILVLTCKQLSAERLALVWPYAVNEVLLGLEGDPSQMEFCCELLASLEPARMRVQLTVLDRLEALEEDRLASSLFRKLSPAFYPVFSQLLHSTRGPAIGGLLLTRLQAEPPSKTAGAVLPLIPKYNNSYRDFLAALLLEGKMDSPQLLRPAAKIILQHLPHLPAKQRSEPWVADSIRILGKAGNPAAQTLLSQIAKSRRFAVLYLWPKACRQAALEARGAFAERTADPVT